MTGPNPFSCFFPKAEAIIPGTGEIVLKVEVIVPEVGIFISKIGRIAPAVAAFAPKAVRFGFVFVPSVSEAYPPPLKSNLSYRTGTLKKLMPSMRIY